MVTNERGRQIARAMKPGKALTKLQDAERAVKRLVERDLNENQFSALACLIADIGASSFSRRALRRMIRDAHTKEDWWRVRDEFLAMADTEENPSKQRRRRLEAKLFSTPSLVVSNIRGPDDHKGV